LLTKLLKLGPLTPAEGKVLWRTAEGDTNKQIGVNLHNSEHTVKTHKKHITRKIGSKNAAHMVTIALREGFLKLLSIILAVNVALGCVVSDFGGDTSLRRPPRGVRVSRTVSRVRVEWLGEALV